MNPFSDRKWGRGWGIWRGRGMFRRVDSLHTVEKCNAFVSKLRTRTYGTGNAWISHVSQDCSIFPRLEWCTLFLARLVWKKALGIGNIESYSLSLSLSTSALFVLDSRVFPLTKRKLFPSSSLFFACPLISLTRNTFPRSLPNETADFPSGIRIVLSRGGNRDERSWGKFSFHERFETIFDAESSCVRDDEMEKQKGSIEKDIEKE